MVTRAALIEGQEHTIITPIIKKITDDINRQLVQDSDSFLYLKTKYEEEGIDVPDYLYDNTLGGPNIDIEYTIEPHEVIKYNFNHINPMSNPILYDPDTRFTVRPYYQMVDIKITFTYRTQSKQQALNLKNRLYTFFISSPYKLIHDLEYSYQLPYSIITLANEIKTLKEFKGSVYDYLENISLFNLDYSIKRGSNYKIPTFRGIEKGRLGYLLTDPTESPINPEHNDVPEYKISFDYMVSFHMPKGLWVDIPMLVNNKRISNIWLPKEKVTTIVEKEDNRLNITDNILKYISGERTVEDIIFKIPSNDQFSPLACVSKYDYVIRWLSLLLEIDKNDLYTLFNLNDLKYIGVDDYIIDYMKRYKDKLFKIGGCGIYLELLEYNNVKDYGLYVDKDFNIKSTNPLDIKGIYHMVFSFITDISVLVDLDNSGKEDTIKLLNKYGIMWYDSGTEVERAKWGYTVETRSE